MPHHASVNNSASENISKIEEGEGEENNIQKSSPPSSLENQNDREIPGYLITTISLGPRAWFLDQQEAIDWARENYFGQWLLAPFSIPNKPIFSEDDIRKAKEKAKEFETLFEGND